MDKTNKNYFRCHSWLIYWHGRASKCENKKCSYINPKRYEWALKKGFNYEKNRNNYIMLCPSCHRKYDYTEQARKKISDSRIGKAANNKRPVKSISDTFCEILYTSMTEASQLTGILITSISNNLKGLSKKAGGLKWEYIQKN